MGCVHTVVPEPPLPSSLLAARPTLPATRRSLVPILLRDPGGPVGEWASNQTACLPSASVVPLNGRAFPAAWPATSCWNFGQAGVWDYLHLSPGQESLWSDTGPCWDCL